MLVYSGYQFVLESATRVHDRQGQHEVLNKLDAAARTDAWAAVVRAMRSRGDIDTMPVLLRLNGETAGFLQELDPFMGGGPRLPPLRLSAIRA